MIAPITKWKMPSVRQVIGAEMSSMIGLMNALTIPRTRPVRSSEMYLSASPKPYDAFPQVMPGTKKAAIAIAIALISARQMIRTAETLNQYWASIPRRRMACSARAKTQRPSGYDTRVSPISTRYSSAGSNSGRAPSACTRRISFALPTTCAIDILRVQALGARPLFDPVLEYLVLIGLTLVSYPLGLWAVGGAAAAMRLR